MSHSGRQNQTSRREISDVMPLFNPLELLIKLSKSHGIAGFKHLFTL